MGAIVYYQKVLEDTEQVTYRYGDEEDNLVKSLVIHKTTMRPNVDPEKASFGVQLAFSGIIKGYRKQGKWPEQGAGYG